MSMAYECHSKKKYLKNNNYNKKRLTARCAIDQNALQVNVNSRGSPPRPC